MSCRYDIILSDDGRYEKLIQSHNLRMRSQSRNFRMQILRQLVSHPFNVYSFSFIPIRYEETVSGQFVTDQTMIDASSKLRVLDAMLGGFVPAGHRVLIFVQFVEVETSDAFDVDAASSRRLLSLP